jgi:alkylhydroperoxidase family enzyme
MPSVSPAPDQAAPRIAPLEPPFAEGIGELLQKMTPPGAPNILALFRVLAVNLKLAERMMGMGSYFLGKPALLALRDREVVIDRVCARCGAEYEWGVHVAAFAQAAGFSKEEVAAFTAHPPALGELTARDALLVRMADELHDTSNVSDALWNEMAAHWQPPQLLELLMLAGWYHAIAYVCNAARVPLESWQARFFDAG